MAVAGEEVITVQLLHQASEFRVVRVEGRTQVLVTTTEVQQQKALEHSHILETVEETIYNRMQMEVVAGVQILLPAE